MSSRILLIEDEPGLVVTLRDLIESEGYRIETASDGETGLRLAQSQPFHLVILDVMLPRKSGLEVCRELRKSGSKVPVLMLTAKSQTADRIFGLKLGADDYVGKPFDPEELLARVEAILRRTNRAPSTVRKISFGDIEVDFERAEVSKSGAAISLATKELQLLQYLAENPDRIVTRDEVLQNVWKYSSDVSSRTIDVHVAWLRQKLEDRPQNPRHILTVRGRGYRFAP
jgi:two-component system alkaline phosphatase synthesis response regulator PhoP